MNPRGCKRERKVQDNEIKSWMDLSMVVVLASGESRITDK
jgi:hypothetical protein